MPSDEALHAQQTAPSELTAGRQMRPHLLRRVFSRENALALALCLMLLALVVLTADASPRWIYQGF
jgi:hypothetical protein